MIDGSNIFILPSQEYRVLVVYTIDCACVSTLNKMLVVGLETAVIYSLLIWNRLKTLDRMSSNWIIMRKVNVFSGKGPSNFVQCNVKGKQLNLRVKT